MPQLDDLNVNDLIALQNLVDELLRAANHLDAAGYEPRADLTPGQPARITLTNARMPGLGASDGADEATRQSLVEVDRDFAPGSQAAAAEQIRAFHRAVVEADLAGHPMAAALMEPRPAAFAPDPRFTIPVPDALPPSSSRGGASDTPAGPQAPAGEGAPAAGANPPQAATLSEPAEPGQATPQEPDEPARAVPAPADSGGGAADCAPAAPEAPAATHQRAFMGKPWTAEDDERLVEIAARAMAGGVGFHSATTGAAPFLDRTGATCYQRAHSKLRDRIAARVKALKDEAAAAAGAVEAPPDRPATIPPPPPPAETLDAHLAAMELAYGLDICADLLRLACLGLSMDDIAQELDLKPVKVRAMFDTLTGLHRDEADKWRRRFTREELLAAVEALRGAQPQAAE